jgi:O-antigen ligase
VAAGAAALAVVLTGGMPLQRAADAIGDVRGYAGAAPFESASGTTIGARLEAWRSAIGAFVQRPVLGVGWGNLQEHFRLDVARGDRHPRIAEFTHAHQQGLGALASGGVVGLAMLTALLAIPGRFFARAWSSADDVDRTVGLTGLLVIAAYVVFGLTEAIFESVVPLAFYAVSVGALVSQLTVERHRRVTAQPSSRAVTLTYEGRAPIATLPAPAGVLPRDRTRDARDRPRVAQHPTMVRTSRR